MVSFSRPDSCAQPMFGDVPTDRRSETHSLPAVTAVASGEVKFTQAQAEIVFGLERQAHASSDGMAEYKGLRFGKGYLGQLAKVTREQLDACGVDL